MILLWLLLSGSGHAGVSHLTHTGLRPGVHLLSGGADGNVLVLVADEGLLVVDGQAVDKLPAVREAIAGVSDAPVRYVVNTHYHPDHVGANAAYAAEGATVVSHARCRDAMTRRSVVEELAWTVEAAPEDAWPTLTYDERLTLHVGDERVELTHLPAAHTDGDTVVHLREADVLHTGDLFEVGAYPFLDIWHGGSLGGLVAACDALLARCSDDTILVPGHGPPSARGDLVAYRAMLATLLERVTAAVAAGQSAEEFLAGRPVDDFDPRWGSPRAAARLAAIAFLGVTAGEPAATGAGRNAADRDAAPAAEGAADDERGADAPHADDKHDDEHHDEHHDDESDGGDGR